MKARLDDIDLQILRLLQDNGRVTNADLARDVKLSPPSVLQRVRKLEETGVVRGYSARLEPEALGYGITIFALVSLAMHQEQPIDRFRSDIQALPEVVECYHISGEFDFLLKIVMEDMGSYERFIRERLSRLDAISKIQSCFVMANVKDNPRLPI